MLFAARPTSRRGLAVGLATLLAALGLLALVSPSAQAAPSGWGQFTFAGSSRDFTGTLTQQAAGFPQATFTSTSVGGGVGVQSGRTTWLSTATDVGATYGSSRDQGYLNLRPYNQNGAPPSVTTYTFDRPTPSAGWTFVLGDVDADQVTVSATGPGGVTVDPAELGFRSVFNYCTPGVCSANADVPSWNPATGVLLGNAQALDTNGASAWFEPTVPLTSLTFTFAQRAGFPVYQTWFSALEYDLTGTVTAPAGQQDGITVVLYDPEGNEVGRTTTDADGGYEFPGYATYDGYRVQVVRPAGLTSDAPLTQTVDLSEGDQVADFTLRAIVPVPVSGTVTDPGGRPVAGVTITLTPPGGGTPRTAVTEADGTYVFEDVAVGDGYTLTATPPAGSTVSAPLTVDVPSDSEDPIEDQDFVVTPIPTGTASGRVREGSGSGPGLSGVTIRVEGPGGATYTAVTDDDGNWNLSDLPPGDYTATVVALDGTTIVGDAEVDFVIGDDGADAEDVDFVLEIEEPATFTAGGRVTDDDGQPIAGVRVTLTDPTTGTTRDATTNAQGFWSLDGLDPATSYTATVTVPDGYDPVGATTRTFDVVNADVPGQDFVLQREVASPSPSPSSPSVSPSSAPTTSFPQPTVTETAVEVVSGSGSSGTLAETGGPSLMIGLGGVALVLAGLLALAGRRRGRPRR